MHLRRLTLLIVTAVLIVGLPTFSLRRISAQGAADPIILIDHGDLWAWDNPDLPKRQLTSWGMNEQPILSPDGTKVVYLSFAQVFADWLKTITGGTGGYIPPENLWLLDVASGETTRIADQPADAVWAGLGRPGKYILRSTPSWSPDGHSLAWAEILVITPDTASDLHGNTAQVVVFDLATSTSRAVASHLIPASTDLDIPVKWGQPGIALVDGQNNSNSQHYRVYAPDGKLLTHIPLGDQVSPNLFMSSWITHQNQDYLFEPFSESNVTWLNWKTLQPDTMPGSPEMYSLSTPGGASFIKNGKSWILALPGQSLMDLGEHITPRGISRDGQRVVYTRWEYSDTDKYYADTVIEQSADQTVQIGRYINAEVVWGPVGWRIKSEK